MFLMVGVPDRTLTGALFTVRTVNCSFTKLRGLNETSFRGICPRDPSLCKHFARAAPRYPADQCSLTAPNRAPQFDRFIQFGGPSRTRTDHLRLAKAALSQMSYRP